jgi:uncharacterized protein DUF4326
METTIVSVLVADIRPQYHNLREWMEDGDNVYIGRRGIVFIDGERFPKKDSIWANPYKAPKNKKNSGQKQNVPNLTVESAIEKYEIYINKKINDGEITVDQIRSLKGKRLGCWCKIGGKNLPCHGDVLLKIIENL